MVFSDTTNKNGIMQMIEQTTGIGDAIVTGSTIQKAYFTNLINQWYRIAAYFAWKVDKNWAFDDTNQTTFPMATADIVNNQRDYTLPSDALRIRQVEVMQSNGDYTTVEFMPENSGVLYTQKEQEDAGVPTHYRLVGGSVILYPKPNTSVLTATDGLRVTTDREVDAFVVGDTTQEPGLAKEFHPILYYGPCLEWATVKQSEGVKELCLRMLGGFSGLMDLLSDFYGSRNQNVISAISPIKKRYK